MVDCWAIRDCPTECPWYDPILCRKGMECVLSTIHQFKQWRNHSHSILRWLFRCHRHLRVLTLPAAYSSINHYHLVGWEVVQHEIGIERHWRDGTLIDWEWIVQLHFLLPSITKHFYHNELVHGLNWGRHLIIHVFYRQLEFEYVVQSHDIAFQIAEQDQKSIESGNHRFADILHRSTVVGRGIVNDHCGKQIVVLVGNLQIEGSDQRWIHLNHLAISSEISHIRDIERSR